MIKDYCTTCGSKEDLMPNPYSWNKRNPEKHIGYRMCNPCNTARQRKYYGTEVGQANIYGVAKRQYIKNRKHVLARVAVREALNSGKLTKPLYCESCKQDKPVDGHHPDYDFPLQVLWLCRQCHAKLHRELKSV